ncbi:sugar ABC transporter ATP-binding protein [Pseudalkalibacillus salsuginis]|uniref:sugar ABC transporter ATP-binding protein n=1 Tax=Pseudalkalibacillus salsuginis TaxID=2910972 RepID=UPI001F17C061|nr:sugar ABC transporter ATP-binding protein [Pseudalkalibacillus salsuginis]MCF6409829.1 sugar ABC transporter ATP-binding protein [Pseudalkalibacillus salsuginis]
MSQLIMRNINKRFDKMEVLKNVTFSVKAGEVHALLGVNGAGKSTLMKILAGDYEKDGGTIEMDGKEIAIGSPSDAKRHGIGIVVQEVDTALFPTLSIAENLVIDDYTSGFKLSRLSWRSIRKQAEAILTEMNILLDVNKQVADCSLSEKQMILIARAIAGNVRYLILDEPTAPLSENETETLFRLIKKLREKGVGIIYISHRMPEIKRISDRFTVLRDGKLITTEEIKNTTTGQIIRQMLGKSLQNVKRQPKPISPNTLLEVKKLHVPDTGKEITLKVHEGEIVGIAGLVGAGKSETAKALFGAGSAKGSWIINGKDRKIVSPYDALKHGLSLVPEERRKEGIVTGHSVAHNLSLPSLKSFTKFGWLQLKKEKVFSKDKIKQLGIVAPSEESLLKNLSGGNQQKVAIGKWISQDRNVFLFDEPTKGIDVNAKREIFQLIDLLAGQGKGIVYFTSEIEELLLIADRILVMYDGEITSSFTGAEATRENIMQAATGGKLSETNS